MEFTNNKPAASTAGLDVTGNTQESIFSYPNPASVKGRVLGALLRSEKLTHHDCWVRYGSARLSHHIHVLRGAGWDISMIEKPVTTRDAGRTASIGVYWLDADIIERSGKKGQHYAEECAAIEAERLQA